jgi:divalent metal cation (Fe/Co/Zn/Cd) transporter
VCRFKHNYTQRNGSPQGNASLTALLVRQVEHKILVSCHCAMDGSLPITQIHDVTGELEIRVKEKFPQIARVTIHPEPVEER